MGIMQELEVGENLPEKRVCYEGVFYNYFSVGMHYAFFILRKFNQNMLFRTKGNL